jgi:hypothetical protein
MRLFALAGCFLQSLELLHFSYTSHTVTVTNQIWETIQEYQMLSYSILNKVRAHNHNPYPDNKIYMYIGQDFAQAEKHPQRPVPSLTRTMPSIFKRSSMIITTKR